MSKAGKACSAGVHSRGYIPHIEGAEFQFITYRLADALPVSVLNNLRNERSGKVDRRAVEHAMDAGYGCCCLAVPALAECVVENWWRFDGKRYDLLAYVVMPNHVHVLIRVYEAMRLSQIVHGWKSYTSKKILGFDADVLGEHAAGFVKLQGSRAVWQQEYWDRYIRDDDHFRRAVRYIHENPVKAGLVDSAELWAWSSDCAIERL